MSRPAWIKVKERGNALGISIVALVMNILGYRAAVILLYPIVFYFYISSKKSRKFSLLYLSSLHSFDSKAHRSPRFIDGFRHFFAFAVNALDRIWLWKNNGGGFDFELQGEDKVGLYTEKGRGCLMLGAHLGNFDALRVLAKKLEVKINVVGYANIRHNFDRTQQKNNPQSLINFVDLQNNSVDGVIILKNALENGELVAMMGDRFVDGSRPRIVFADFLKKEAAFPENPWIVANLLEAPVFMVAATRGTDMKYSCVIEQAADKVVLDPKTRSLDMSRYVKLYARFLESICVQYPYQWFNFYDFWSKRI